MKTRVLKLVSCLAGTALLVGLYSLIVPEEVMAFAPSGKCCLETGGGVEVSSTDCDARCGVFSGAGTSCSGPFPDCPIPPISVAPCCLPDDTCTVTTLCQGDNAGGTPAGVEDCADADCGGAACGGNGDPCTIDDDCCSNKCKNGSCRGN